MKIKFFNTLTRKKEVFKPLEDKLVRLYTCGPTVYWFPHIGNMRAFVFEDILKRVLLLNGYKVFHVMNITDVGHLVSDADSGEDKIEKAAREEKKTAWEIAEFYTKAFFKDIETLNIIKADIYPRATQHINEMIELVKKLEEKGYTYVIDDGVYFDTSKFKDYGKLTGMSFEELNKYLKAGARVEFNPQKRNITDFALWKFSPKDVKRQMEWDSPWGKGFPGWHLECSVMSMKYLGETFDIHCGGVDHIPIHHTNEIAQSEAATGKKFVNYWLHCEFLLVEGKKMAKSLGNIYTVSDILKKGYSWREIRYVLIASHYRQQLNFTFKSLEAARASIQRISEFLRKLKEVEKGKHEKAFTQILKKFKKEFLLAINDDLNIPKALSSFFDFLSEVNKLLAEKKLTKKDSKKAIDAVLFADKIFGLKLEEFLEEEKLPEEAEKLIKEREEARKRGDFETADKIRKELAEKFKIAIEDTPEGTKWRKID
jgi:cysteinyl-tRNA synthetase